MSNFPVIDTDGHVLERQSDTRKYLDVEYADIRDILIELGPAKSANKP